MFTPDNYIDKPDSSVLNLCGKCTLEMKSVITVFFAGSALSVLVTKGFLGLLPLGGLLKKCLAATNQDKEYDSKK